MIRLIHGDDEFAIANSLQARLDALAPSDLQAPNVTVFEGPRVDMLEVFAIARISPFMADKRAIVVKGMLKPIDTPGQSVRKDWQTFGERVAEEAMHITNELIFVEYSPLRMQVKALKTLASVAEVEKHQTPTRRELEAWIRQRFERHGVRATQPAMARFRDLGGADPRRLDSEIQKLAVYADGRMLQPDDIELMVADDSEDRIFAVMDAIIEGRHRAALSGVQKLLASGESIEGIMALLSRQVRTLIVASYMLERRASQSQVGAKLNLRMPWLLNKNCQQARRVGHRRLRTMLLHMLEIDTRLKTGRADRRLALEMLVAGMVNAPAR